MEMSNCPHLGLQGDPATFSTYPSQQNFCHHVRLPQAVHLDYQGSMCLGPNHKNCPVYQEEEKPRLLPPEIRTEKTTLLPMRKKSIWFVVVVMVLLILVLVVDWPLSLESWLRSQPTPTFQEVVPTKTLKTSSARTQPPTLTPIPTFTPTHSPTLTPTPTKTKTPSPTYGPSIGTPFGPESRFLIHTIEEGQSFAYLETKYNTTGEVIEAINNLIEGTSLWVGENVVIVIGQKETSDLPKFEVLLTEKTTKLTDLAEQYGTQVADIRYYNSLGPKETVPADRWLIIPLGQ